ncbi:hypothetical protein [Staphylococcus edaphicus]|uniref:Uncharacterized protein n=1 Tax=Staphylococcus edaphicus TaxID=1955013 RepID=A0A2C6WPA1_9STAP|nr:hypothetical protein [Staphylococcus edaphicus]PHK49287.1 hypothetical protein BTJ66_08945 [Staphylococcus edaphicus]UQW81009.1 hypothetical protein MNY58_10540 [Staphylococcus edaphicus]
MKKHDPFNDLEQQKPYQKKGLRQIMTNNDDYESHGQTKNKLPYFIILIILCLIAFVLIATLIF